MNMSYCCSEFSPAIAIVRFLDFGHSNRYIVVSHGIFNEIFLVTNDIECIFMLYAIHISSSVKSLHVCFCLTVPCLIYIIDALTLNSQPTAQAHLIHVIFL